MKRHLISLLIAMLLVTLVITGVMGFFLPFNLLTVSLHALVGFVFTAAIALHIRNNFRQLRGYFGRRSALIVALFVTGLIWVILMQPRPVKALLSLSQNLGPELDRFELSGSTMTYSYTPAADYRMQLRFKGGPSFDPDHPPCIAIWIENKSAYHIKSLHHSERPGFERMLPYWHHKRSEFLKYRQQEQAKRQAAKPDGADALSSATENYSYDPKDYIVPQDPGKQLPYRVLIEINMPDDGNGHHPDQPSLVYSVEVDNLDPRTYQVLEIVGYPKLGVEDGENRWALHYVDETITTALDLFDSALLEIDRSNRP